MIFVNRMDYLEKKTLRNQLRGELIGVGNVCDLFQLEVLLSTNDDGTNPEIDISLSTRFNEDIATLGIPIHYCPVCGRKLVD